MRLRINHLFSLLVWGLVYRMEVVKKDRGGGCSGEESPDPCLPNMFITIEISEFNRSEVVA